MPPPLIGLSGIGKRFGAVVALDGVDLTVNAGEVHGVVGENGAGKSTLMHVLFGLVQPDAGVIAVDGVARAITSARVAQRLGIGMVHQHFTLVPTLDAVDNLALATARGWGRVDRARVRREADAIAARLGWTLPHDAPVGELPVAQQQRLEIVKALAGGGRLLIMDEPTAVLAPQEVARLIDAVASLARSGTAVLFISHKLGEIEAACERITVLRRGRVVHHGEARALPRERLARLMVGDGAEVALPRPRAATPGEPRLVLEAVTIAGPTLERPRLREVSLTVRSREVVGIAGIEGNGQDALVAAAIGLAAPDHGAVRRAPGAVALIPADRRHEGLMLEASVRANLLLRAFRRRPYARRVLGVRWLAPSAWRQRARELIETHAIRTPSQTTPVARLSGGNQQKVVVARELGEAPSLVVAVNPTRGLDLAAATAVLTHLVEARDAGAGVLLVHHDLDELLAISDRVLVLNDGRLRDSGWPATTRAAIGDLMTDAHA